MTAFATQLGQITEALGGPGGKEAAPKPAPQPPATSTEHLPKLQTGLKVRQVGVGWSGGGDRDG